MRSDFSVISIYTHETPNMKSLAKSAELFGWPMVFKKISAEPRPTHEEFLRKKHYLIADTLLELELKRFLFVDAYDTIFIAPPPKCFGEAETYLGMGGELNCYPIPYYAPIFDTRGFGPFKYPNSGVIWGATREYLKLMPAYYEHDQLAWTRACVEHPQIYLDRWGAFVVNLHSTDPDKWTRAEGGRWVYDLSEGQVNQGVVAAPFVLHGNGGWPIPSWAMEYGK